jgi:hypothetical protein
MRIEGTQTPRKLGGVLIESVPVGQRRMVVIGLGLNIARQPVVDLNTGFACMQEFDPGIDAPRALARIAKPWVEAVLLFQREGFTPFKPRFDRLDCLKGLLITTTLDDLPSGVAEGGSHAPERFLPLSCRSAREALFLVLRVLAGVIAPLLFRGGEIDGAHMALGVKFFVKRRRRRSAGPERLRQQVQPEGHHTHRRKRCAAGAAAQRSNVAAAPGPTAASAADASATVRLEAGPFAAGEVVAAGAACAS